MAFNDLKKKLDPAYDETLANALEASKGFGARSVPSAPDDQPFTELPVQVTGTKGLDPSAHPLNFLGQLLDKGSIETGFGMNKAAPGDDRVEQDYASPLDLLVDLKMLKMMKGR